MEQIEGIILKKINYKESSKILYLYTASGLKSVLVHGSNKMKSPYLSLTKTFSHVSLFVTGKDLKTLRDGDIVNSFPRISENLEKYTYVLHILEIIYFVSTHDHDHEKLYQFLLKIFEIVELSEEYIPYLNMIELKLLYLLGVNPLFQHCTSCDRTDHLQLSVKAGGMCCPEHLKKDIYLDDAATEAIISLYYHDVSKHEIMNLPTEILKQIRSFLDQYYEYHLNFQSNSRKILLGLIGY